MLSQVGLISQARRVEPSELTVVSAAISKQVTRDFGPIWSLQASVDPFGSLDQMPLGYWPVIIRDDIPYDAQGIHLNEENGHPYSLVQYSTNWAVTTSHEVLEMLADPSGNRTVTGNSMKSGQGRVEYLVEVCDPSEAAENGYTQNGVLLSDFYTPQFFDPVPAAGVRYSFTGAIEKPRQVPDGGYLSWFDPISKHLFQWFVEGGTNQFVDQGPMMNEMKSLRELSDRMAAKRRGVVSHRGAPKRNDDDRRGFHVRAGTEGKEGLAGGPIGGGAGGIVAEADRAGEGEIEACLMKRREREQQRSGRLLRRCKSRSTSWWRARHQGERDRERRTSASS
jgi:hypothetical protein